jgi:hypothetical protein
MTSQFHIVRIVIVLFILSDHPAWAATSSPLSAGEEVLEVIRACMGTSPAPWPEAWCREYIDTIRQATTAGQNTVPSAPHLQALGDAFPSYWQGLTKSENRAHFEVQSAEIQWYTEHLMRAALPSETEKQKRCDRWKGLWGYATTSLLTQFPFLDPNLVREAEKDLLAQCHRHIDAPLIPVFACLLPETQIGQVKQRWHDLRYARVDFWQQLGGEAMIVVDRRDIPAPQAHPHYLLSQRSLIQFQTHIQAMATVPPDYYRDAWRHSAEVERQRRKSLSQARRAEHRLERDHAGQLLQAEYLSFLLAALLETVVPVRETSSIEEQQ